MIVAAAIKQNEAIYTLPAPARHHDIIKYMVEVCNVKPPVDGEQGFIDSKMGFLNRTEAAARAIFCKQITKPNWGKELFSEDLW